MIAKSNGPIQSKARETNSVQLIIHKGGMSH